MHHFIAGDIWNDIALYGGISVASALIVLIIAGLVIWRRTLKKKGTFSNS